MKNKEKIIPIVVFLMTFIVFIIVFVLINNVNKDKYSCYDYEKDMTYTFKTEEEMHQVCDKLNGNDDDQIMESYPIYDELLKVNDPDFSFYPYINDDKKLAIIIAISNCEHPAIAKEKAEQWFSDHSYNIKDYVIEYENSCIVE